MKQYISRRDAIVSLLLLFEFIESSTCSAFCRPVVLSGNMVHAMKRRTFTIRELRGGDQIEETIQDIEQQQERHVVFDTEQDEYIPQQQAEDIVDPTSNEEEIPPIQSIAATTVNANKIDISKMATAMVMVPVASFGKFYADSLSRAPILTKSATAGIVFILSDILAQKLDKGETSSPSTNKKKLQLNRIVASGIIGFAYFGPAAHYWYEWMFTLIPSTTLLGTLQKAALGQLLFGPIFNCIFFASTLIQSNSFTISKWFSKIRNDLPSVIVAGVGFWPLVDIISYSYIPPKFIPLFINFCSLLWTTYLALKSYS